jgi:hypothetical protein
MSSKTIKTLSQQVSTEPVCAVLIILAILSVPKYVKLPDSLVLLFHDMFGQILLLLFAILVGSYSFLCGILLVILFISIMMQTKVSTMEGFVGSSDSDMALNKKKTVDTFEDIPVTSNKTATSSSTTQPSLMTTPMTTSMPMIQTSTTMPMPTQMALPSVAGSATPAPTLTAVAAQFPSDIEGYKSTIKKLEEELNECKATNLTLRTNMPGAGSVPLPTMGTNINASKPETFEDVDSEFKLSSKRNSNNKPKPREITVMSTDDGAEELEDGKENVDEDDGEDVEEGFCGCDTSDNRVKLAKVVAQSEPSFNGDSPYENFQNPPTVPQMKSSLLNPYDVAGCRYDNDFEKDLHDTFYGPPLASCRAYNGSTKSIGTLFYPMN